MMKTKDRRRKGRKQPPIPKRSLLVIDSNAICRQGIVWLIEQQPDLRVIASTESVEEALRLLASELPNLILVDAWLPGIRGTEAILQLRQSAPGCSILVHSLFNDIDHAQRFLQAGAQGYITKGTGASVLLEGIRSILSGTLRNPIQLRPLAALSPDSEIRLRDLKRGRKEVLRRIKEKLKVTALKLPAPWLNRGSNATCGEAPPRIPPGNK